MPDRGIGIPDTAPGEGVAEVRGRQRSIGGTTYVEQYVVPISERVASFKGSAATFRIPGNATSPHNLFSLENGAGTGVLVALRRVTVQMDMTAATTAVATQIVASRPTALPTGGAQLNKQAFDTNGVSASAVIARGANAADGSSAIAITATAGSRFWQQFIARMHTLAGQVIMEDQSVIPALAADDPIILRPGEAFLVQAVNATAANNKSSDHYIVNCMWEEFTLP